MAIWQVGWRLGNMDRDKERPDAVSLSGSLDFILMTLGTTKKFQSGEWCIKHVLQRLTGCSREDGLEARGGDLLGVCWGSGVRSRVVGRKWGFAGFQGHSVCFLRT